MGVSWGVFWPSWALLGRSWRDLDRLEVVLGSWVSLGASWGELCFAFAFAFVLVLLLLLLLLCLCYLQPAVNRQLGNWAGGAPGACLASSWGLPAVNLLLLTSY